jgi:uncharacterized coiled-coil protein SlyX
MSKGSWIKGVERDQIMAMLIAGENHKTIGERTGHDKQVIDNFSSRHKIEIQAARQQIALKLNDYWLTVKAARIGKAQERHLLLTERLAELDEDNEDLEEDQTPLMIKIAVELRNIERQAGEEAGQLLTRMPNPGPDPKPVAIIIDRPSDD